jgi:uncharacterized protein YqjF (DUF2071 family)
MKTNKKPFLTGAWKNLVILTYSCDPALLTPFLPKTATLDLYEGKALLSWVFFTFSKAKLFGCRIPAHQFFPELNIRTYVKDKNTGAKGVLFLKEMAPKKMVTWTAKYLYNEPFYYQKLKVDLSPNEITYQFPCYNQAQKLQVQYQTSERLPESKLEKFIIERKLAFVKQKNNHHLVYNIQRKPWNIQELKQIAIPTTLINLFEKQFTPTLSAKPLNISVLDGSEVEVFSP